MTAQEIFELEYGKVQNPLTPYVVEYGREKNYVWQISRGNGPNMKESVMVSVVRWDPTTHTTERMHDMNKSCFTAMDAARDYILKIEEMVRSLDI